MKPGLGEIYPFNLRFKESCGIPADSQLYGGNIFFDDFVTAAVRDTSFKAVCFDNLPAVTTQIVLLTLLFAFYREK